MHRFLVEDLKMWKDRKNRKPLLLKGSRQVGKTWLLKNFGKKEFEHVVYFSLDREPDIAEIFQANKRPADIIRKLSYIAERPIEPGKTLLILDEIQTSREALDSLKYFKEDAPEYHIAAAGSLLGIYLSGMVADEPKNNSPELTIPVGTVDILHLNPLSFSEFLYSADEKLYDFYSSIKKEQHIETIFHERLTEMYNLYLIIGGMPECVASWIENKDFTEVNRLQDNLLELYEYDITKYHGKVDPDKILLVFRRIVSQLAKPNEKFIYGALRKGARAKEYEGAIEWLCSAGLVNRIYNITKPEFPLKAYEDLSAFKLYFFDTGLLKHMAGLDNSPILTKTSYQFKGPLTENYVLQQIKGQMEMPLVYYSTKNMELDFIMQSASSIIPIEVKGEEDKIAPSFKRYIADNKPETAIRFSKMNYQKSGMITNIPLYLANRVKTLL